MLYRFLLFLAGFAQRWFFRDAHVVGVERVPQDGPLIVAANHPNQVLDVIVVGRALGRRLTFTGKATLFGNPLLRWLLTSVGFVPLQRAKDVAASGQKVDASRNREAFRAVLDALDEGRAVLIFPEGISHDEPALAPLKTGAARMALQARDERGLAGLRVLPVGISYERKFAARSRVVLEIGEPIDMDAWSPPRGGATTDASDGAASSGKREAEALTAELDARLRAVTLNFASREEQARVLGLSRLIAPLFDEPRALGEPQAPMPEMVSIARRVAAAERALGSAAHAPPALRARVEAFERRLVDYRTRLDARRLSPSDVAIDLGARRGLWFAVRETLLLAVGGLVALWGRLNHWLAFRLTRLASDRLSRTPEDPAMNTVVVGLLLVLLSYALGTALVWRLAGAWWALAYLVSLPACATWDLRFTDRLRRARARMRTYLALRREPALRERLVAESEWLRGEVTGLEAELSTYGQHVAEASVR